MTTVTEQIEKAIAKAGGSTRDALNIALSDFKVKEVLLRREGKSRMALEEALEAIRALLWPGFPTDTATTEAIDKIAREALRASGQIPTCTTEED